MPDLPITDPIFQFTILVTVALIVQLTVERLAIPGIVGLLVIGMFLGPGGYEVLDRGPVVTLLGSVGLVYIMFLAGLEIDLDVVRHHKAETGTVGVLAFSLSLAPAIGIGMAYGYGWTGAILLGAALSSHTLISYPMVESRGLVHQRPVVAAVGGTLITDTLALVLLVLVVQSATAGANVWDWSRPIVLLVALVLFSILVIPRLASYFFRRLGKGQAENALFALAVVMLLSSTADLIETESILGAFLAGVCLNEAVRAREDFRHHLQFVGRMLFIPFFFIETGMRLELEVFTGETAVWGLSALLVGGVLLGKAAAAWISGHVFDYSVPARVLMTGMTIPQAAATLAVVVIGQQAGIFDDTLVDAIIIAIFFTCILGPVITRFAIGKMKERALPDETSPHAKEMDVQGEGNE
jgi:Kef-type K+ transport system membrane component KefB